MSFIVKSTSLAVAAHGTQATQTSSIVNTVSTEQAMTARAHAPMSCPADTRYAPDYRGLLDALIQQQLNQSRAPRRETKAESFMTLGFFAITGIIATAYTIATAVML